jgi:hypothetical protein
MAGESGEHASRLKRRHRGLQLLQERCERDQALCATDSTTKFVPAS